MRSIEEPDLYRKHQDRTEDLENVLSEEERLKRVRNPAGGSESWKLLRPGSIPEAEADSQVGKQ